MKLKHNKAKVASYEKKLKAKKKRLAAQENHQESESKGDIKKFQQQLKTTLATHRKNLDIMEHDGKSKIPSSQKPKERVRYAERHLKKELTADEKKVKVSRKSLKATKKNLQHSTKRFKKLKNLKKLKKLPYTVRSKHCAVCNGSGACASCKGCLSNTKGSCAQCWEPDSKGRACLLGDGSGCQKCWAPVVPKQHAYASATGVPKNFWDNDDQDPSNEVYYKVGIKHIKLQKVRDMKYVTAVTRLQWEKKQNGLKR